MAVSGGYPGEYSKGMLVSGLENIRGSVVFHAGTRNRDGNVVTSGGRVLAVTSWGKSIKEALDISYRNLTSVSFEGIYYRKDIGFDL